MHSLAIVLGTLAIVLAAPATARAADCTEEERVEVVVWTAINWNRIADGFENNPLPCAEYYISIPPRSNDMTLPRLPQVLDEIRAHGPNFHPLAEVQLGTLTGWHAWVNAVPGRTWYQAGVEFRRRMVTAGFDVAKGETWLLNEFNRSTIRDTPPNPGERFYSRADMRELVRGLYEGDLGMPAALGAVEIGINYTHQDIPDVAVYKEELKGFLLDSAFWADMDGRVRWMIKEAYPDARKHGVSGSTRTKRRRHMEQYLFHMADLAAAAPKEASVAKEFLRDTYMTLENATWKAQGPINNFAGGHGWTTFSLEDMLHFVSEQVYATRYYADAHPKFGPARRLGFSWQPTNPPLPSPHNMSAAEFVAGQDAIADRIGAAVQHAYASPDAPAIDACRPPGSEEQWCNSFVPEAEFTPAWLDFAYWK
jgi:hypothetical protein